MQFEWTNRKDGSISHLALARWLKSSGLAAFVADVAQPTGKRDNWHARISASIGGKSLSLESGKIDAVTALRRLVVKLAEALGGTVVWTIKE